MAGRSVRPFTQQPIWKFIVEVLELKRYCGLGNHLVIGKCCFKKICAQNELPPKYKIHMNEIQQCQGIFSLGVVRQPSYTKFGDVALMTT
jgi:hypothetical protein